MDPLISIIVPVYQVEKYLDKCITSIIDQSYKNLEIILVDDGSTDSSPAICDQYHKEDSRVKVIHKQNGGLSQARNAGLEIAQGDYIGFVDSDDWIKKDMYEVMMSSLLETGADIAACSYQMEFEESNTIKRTTGSGERTQYSVEEALKRVIRADGYIRSVVWNKLYNKTIISNIRFPEGKIFEDTLWTTQIISKANMLFYIDYPFYNYLYRQESLSHNKQIIAKRLLDKIEMSEQRIAFLHEYYPSLVKIAISKLQEFCYEESMAIYLQYRHLDVYNELRHELYHHYCQSGPINIQDVKGILNKFGRMLFWFSPVLFEKTYTFIYPKMHKIKLSIKHK